MSRSRLAADAHAGMIVTLVHLGAEWNGWGCVSR